MKVRTLAAVILATAAACTHTPTAPADDARGSHLQFDHAVHGTLATNDTARFYLDAQTGELIAAYTSATDPSVQVAFADSGQPLYPAWTGGGDGSGTTLGNTPVFTYTVPETGAYTIALIRSGSPVEPHAQFALRIDTVFLGPEHLKPSITIGQIVSGESIDSVGDIDVFTFSGTAGKAIIGYLQPTAKSTDGITMQIYANSPDSVLQTVMAPGGDTSLELYTTNALTLPTSGTYHIKLQATSGTYVGPYKFEMYQIDSAPESISATITPGDSVQGESIDHVGDVDVFTVKAKAGASYNLFAQYLGSPNDAIQIHAQNAAGTVLAAMVVAPGPNALTAGSGSGPFTAPASGQFTISIFTDGGILNRGPYRLFLYPINSAPEIAPADFNLGDSVLTETIGLPGDTDRFAMHVGGTTLASVCVSPSLAASGVAPTFIVYNPSGSIWGEVGYQGGACTSGTITSGIYPFVVADPAPTGTFRGLYKINSFTFNAAPEHVSQSITLGDTITGEKIDVPGDYDTFTYRTHPYDQIGIQMISGTPDPTPVWTLSGIGIPYGTFGSAGHFGRFDLPAHNYTFLVQGGSSDATGAYKFVFFPWPTAPEHHSATVALGSSITDEPIDFSDDVDQFTLTGAPGAWGVVSILGDGSSTVTALLMPTDTTVVTQAASIAYVQYSQPFQLNASGNITLRVQANGGPGTYAVTTATVNPSPEHVSAATAIGDTVSGESIDAIGDLDQFTFSGTAGQHINVELQTPNGVAGFTSVILKALSPDGTVLGQVSSDNPGALSAALSTGVITLPTSGQYTINVSTGNWDVPYSDVVPYVFAIIPSS
ncbi:MAG TPA: hypothetical protein VFA43_01545 [Gemmatimonadaceae bacterium]|nr:hypothetical protein [Gemmatimonadaceae bacterium]